MSCLTNLSLNDQMNLNIKQTGAHILGKILMDNCPVLIKDKLIREEKIGKGITIPSYS